MLGCSLGAALKLPSYHRLGWTWRPEVGKWARKKGDQRRDVRKCGGGVCADAPGDSLSAGPGQRGIFDRCAALLRKTLVTDIGSVKSCLIRTANENKRRFAGGRPMAGTEYSGPEADVKGIYADAPVCVTTARGASATDVMRVERLWRAAGAVPVRIGTRAHDALVARASHGPHIVAPALALSALDARGKLKKRRFNGCVGGFRDTIGVAVSSARMRRGILSYNQQAVLRAMTAY